MKKAGISLVLITIMFILVGLFLPTDYRVVRIKYIGAGSKAIHPYVNDLTNWETWVPWETLDPDLVVTPGEITSGVGAHQTWVSDDGTGWLTFTESSPKKGIDYELSFDDGFYKSEGSIHYSENKEGTTIVSWVVKGDVDQPLFGSYLALRLKSRVGAMLEQGLINLDKNVTRDIEMQRNLEPSIKKAL